MGDMDHAAQGRGAARCCLRRWHTPWQKGCGAHRLRRFSRLGLAPVPRREQPRLVGSDAAHRRPRDGRLGRGDGLQKALKETWPHAPHQRCVFHAFSQVKRDTTSRPCTQAGVELYGLAKALLSITTLKEAQGWVGAFIAWPERWNGFLSEQTKTDDGKYVLTHERLVKARGSLARLISAGTLFSYLDPRLEHLAPLPSTNNRIEGGVNSQLRGMLRDHRGLSIERRLKAIFWWCYMHSPSPLPAAGILRVMPTDSSIKAICERLNQSEKLQGAIPQWGDAIVWSELHHSEPWRMDWD